MEDSVSQTLQQLVDKVAQVFDVQQSQTAKIDKVQEATTRIVDAQISHNEKIEKLNLVVSQLKEKLDLYVHKDRQSVSADTTAESAVGSPDNEQDAIEDAIQQDNNVESLVNVTESIDDDDEDCDPLGDLDNDAPSTIDNQVSPLQSTEESSDEVNVANKDDSMEQEATQVDKGGDGAETEKDKKDIHKEQEKQDKSVSSNTKSVKKGVVDSMQDDLSSDDSMKTIKAELPNEALVKNYILSRENDSSDSEMELQVPPLKTYKSKSKSKDVRSQKTKKLKKESPLPRKRKAGFVEHSPVSDDDDDIASDASDSTKEQKVQNIPVEKDEEQDPKLEPNACYVRLEYIPKVILDRLHTHKFIQLNSQFADGEQRRRGRKSRLDNEDPLTLAIRQLCAFIPLARERPQTSSKSKKRNKKLSKKEAEAEEPVLMDDSYSDDSDFVAVKKTTAMQSIPAVDDLEKDRVGSEDEDLDGPALVSDTDEDTARTQVLKNLGRAPTKSEKDSDAESDKSGRQKKKKSEKYFTPNVCRIPENKDSEVSEEYSDDDDFVSVKKKTFNVKSKKSATIASESDDDILYCSSDNSKSKKKKRKHKSGKQMSENEITINSDSSSSDEVKRNTRSRKKVTVASYFDSDFKPKRRKRIKEVSEDSDSDTKKKSKRRKKSDDDDDSSNGDGESKIHKRKDIRQIISRKDLQKQTRQAQDEEQKRKDRVVERQKLFNHFSQDSRESAKDVVLENLVLDVDKSTKESLISMHPEIVKKLKPHQAKGISFLWDSCFESLEQYKKPNNEGSGCILAHCMGLGKTLQTVGFLHAVMTSEHLNIKSALVICPLNTVGNWANELKLWLRDVDKKLHVHKLYGGKNIQARVEDLERWYHRGGVGILHYDRFRELVGEGKRIKKSFQPRIKKCLLDPGPDIVICDEAHIIKNSKSKVSLAINQIRTKRRILLTGTPLQNNLIEYHTMMQFVKPNLLGSIKEFRNRFVNPITNGQHRDSNDHDVRVMKKRAHVLHKLLDGCVQRLDYSVLVPYLPPKYEYVLLIKMTDIQKKLYKHYLESVTQGQGSVAERIKQRKFLADFAILSKIWSHPYSLSMKYNDDGSNEGSDSAGSLRDFIDDDESSKSTNSDVDIIWSDSELQSKKKKTMENGNSTTEPVAGSSAIIQQGGDWWSQFFPSKDDISVLEHGSKLILLFEILKTCESIGDKVLIFSQSLNSLNIIENFLEDLDQQAKKKPGDLSFPLGMTGTSSRRWRKNIEYYRIDGSTKTEDRQRNCDDFNKANISRAKLFLISTRAGGLGINLIGANRVVIFDASWNPSQDLQSIFRVFRFGQTKPCYIYRFLAQGTMEEKVYNRQVVKLSLSGRVVDEHQIERHFKFDDILKMYDCDFDEKSDRPTPPVPKDRLLADLLITHKNILDNYLEHDSLLVNQTDEGLSEAERQAAWNEYQTEKDMETRSHAAMTMQTQKNQEVDQKLRIKLKQLYPLLPEHEMEMYVSKVNADINNLRFHNDSYTNRYHQLSAMERSMLESNLIEKRTEIQRCISEPNYLASLMARLMNIRTYPSAQSASSLVNSLSNTYQQDLGNGIRLAPMNNILEPTNFATTIAQQMAHGLDQVPQHRATILGRNRPILTNTVPYTPSVIDADNLYASSFNTASSLYQQNN